MQYIECYNIEWPPFQEDQKCQAPTINIELNEIQDINK